MLPKHQRPTNYLIDVMKAGRHVALVSTHDADFVDTLEKLLKREGYHIAKSSSPAAPPLRDK